MNDNKDQKLVIAISSRALFDLEKSNAVFESQGMQAYADYQIAHENNPLEKGVAFPLVEKLLSLNQEKALVEVILISRNTADTGLRIFNSIAHYDLNITCAGFSGGQSPYPYINAFDAHLFLSTHADDVNQALQADCAAATLLPHTPHRLGQDQLRIAFDGDAVLFSNESERIYQAQGIDAFSKREIDKAQTPLPGGPFKGFLSALHHLQKQFEPSECPIRTALVTARCAPTHERVVRTLRHWGIRIDEALFLGGRDKGVFLKAFDADIFFDDQRAHCESAAAHVPTGHVPNA
jgi:5'-nucleotidase